MKFFIEGVKTFPATIREVVRNYPNITQQADIDAYVRKQNKQAYLLYVFLAVNFPLLQLSVTVMLYIGGATIPNLFKYLCGQIVVSIVIFVICQYVYGIARSLNTPENRRNMPVHMQARLKCLICEAIPTVFFMLSPLTLPNNARSLDSFDTNWLFYNILQLHISSWSIGTLPHKVGISFVFNLVYCLIANFKGIVKVFLLLRVVMPVMVSYIVLSAVDFHMKQNFLLKRGMKKQESMYRGFIDQVQDPVIILDRSHLIFCNKAAETQLGIDAVNYLDKLRDFKSSTEWTLEEVMTGVLTNDHEILKAYNGVKVERYYRSPSDSDSSRKSTGESPGRRKRTIMKVSVIESANAVMQGGEKTVSAIFRDLTDELERQKRKAEEKYKNMLLFSLSHELKTPLNIFQSLLVESKKHECDAKMKALL
ncbi:MAG: PAS domain-containing protein, partial [Candidatus Pacebacteria bacterium]|nr:PAS domain-containing protein [Candidatus Paceibacterota bacterium]